MNQDVIDFTETKSAKEIIADAQTLIQKRH